MPGLSERLPVMQHHGTENRQSELWLAVHLPDLALEIIATENHSVPLVIIEEINSREFVHITSQAAEQLGIVSGMSLSAACTLYPDLQIHHIDLVAQHKRLQSMADWALQFSPRISLHPPCSLLLEVAGSIQYFGTLTIIQEQIVDTLNNKWKHRSCLAVSPTPGASILLAQSGKQIVVNDITGLRSALGGLSISLLPLDQKRKQQLKKTGIRVLRDLWRLPSAALACRFGMDLHDYLDRTLGKLPDPLPAYQPPVRFQAAYDIPSEVYNYQLLLPYVHKLLDELCSFLRKSDTYASDFFFYLQHQQHTPTVINISLRQPLRDVEHFMMLAKIKLYQQKLTVPVLGIKLIAETLHTYKAQTPGLFSSLEIDSSTENNIESLLEQLHARLDHGAIRNMIFHADHRPEHANLDGNLEKRTYPQIKNPRPFWLLSEPKPLQKKNNRLYHKSIIHLCMGPERIEAGWWDGTDIRRDYYIGIDEMAGSLWIYHDLMNKQLWYLHGLFG